MMLSKFPPFSYCFLGRLPYTTKTEQKSHIESKVDVVSYSPNEIVLSVETNEPGIVVLSEWHYPAWKAWMDGREAPVLRADYALRAVAVTPGAHRIRFAYSSRMFKLGLLISALITAAAAVAVVIARRRGAW